MIYSRGKVLIVRYTFYIFSCSDVVYGSDINKLQYHNNFLVSSTS